MSGLTRMALHTVEFHRSSPLREARTDYGSNCPQLKKYWSGDAEFRREAVQFVSGLRPPQQHYLLCLTDERGYANPSDEWPKELVQPHHFRTRSTFKLADTEGVQRERLSNDSEGAETLSLFRYTLPNGEVLSEFVQFIGIGGFDQFIALRDASGRPVKKSLWERDQLHEHHLLHPKAMLLVAGLRWQISDRQSVPDARLLTYWSPDCPGRQGCRYEEVVCQEASGADPDGRLYKQFYLSLQRCEEGSRPQPIIETDWEF